MKMIKLVALLIAALSLSGCAAAFTDIRANGDGTYTLTYTKSGFFRVYGEVYRCQVQAPTQMVCSNIDRL
jgi:hypothetical protein